MGHLLEPVGLGRDDNDVYLALVVRPSASLAALAEATALPVDVVGPTPTRPSGCSSARRPCSTC